MESFKADRDPLLGYIAYGRDDDGDAFVQITTEDGKCNDDQGMPQVYVYLNDATLYEPKRPVTVQQAGEKIEAEITERETQKQRMRLGVEDYTWKVQSRDEQGIWRYDRPDEDVRTAHAALSDDESDRLYEQFTGDDFEEHDMLTGEIQGLEVALAILKGSE